MIDKNLLHSPTQSEEEHYDVGQWLSSRIRDIGGEAPRAKSNREKIEEKFKSLCQKVKSQMDVNNTLTNEGSTEWLERVHKAVIGDKSEMAYFINKINEVLHGSNLTVSEFPYFYDSLAEAIFHQVWGVSILQKWEKYPESEAAAIRGTELWIDIDGEFVLQDERFESEDVVEHIKRTFTIRSSDSIINKETPELEIEREDGSRITMIQKPRSRENYIMFRRFVVKEVSLEKQAELDTIHNNDIEIFEALSRTMPNMIIAGRVRSAKSTFLKTLVNERDPKYVIAVMEKHFELQLSKQMPNLIFEIQAKEGDLHNAVPRLLRMEHDFIIVGEIRSLETEAYLQACERGERGAFSTYHLTDVTSVVPQITRHLLDEFPNRVFENELERVARNLDIVITMTAERDRRKKRVLSVTEVIWNEEKKQAETHDLIRYSQSTGKYYYSSKISDRLLLLMAEENLHEAKRLVKLLKEREAESSLKDYNESAAKILTEIMGEET